MGAKRLCHPHPSAAVEKNLKSKIKLRDFWRGGGGPGVAGGSRAVPSPAPG